MYISAIVRIPIGAGVGLEPADPLRFDCRGGEVRLQEDLETMFRLFLSRLGQRGKLHLWVDDIYAATLERSEGAARILRSRIQLEPGFWAVTTLARVAGVSAINDLPVVGPPTFVAGPCSECGAERTPLLPCFECLVALFPIKREVICLGELRKAATAT